MLVWMGASCCAFAQEYPGDAWVQHGLATSAKSIQTTMLGGEAEDDSGIAVSDDGTRIAYTLVHPDIENNANVSTLWVMTKGSPESAKQVGTAARIQALGKGFEPGFSPSGRELAFLSDGALVVEHLNSLENTMIKPSSAAESLLGPGFVPTGIQAFAWSPDGNQLGLIVGVRTTAEVRSGVELSATEPYSVDPNRARARLVVYDLITGRWTAVSPASINVDSFDWAPDGQRLAFAGSETELNVLAYMHNDLYISNFHGDDPKKIPLQAGFNTRPLWSPDGRWIAFESQGGQVRYLAEGRVGLYDAKQGTLSYPAFDALGELAGFKAGPLCWAPDSRSLLIKVPYHLSKQLFTLSIPRGHLQRYTLDDDRNFYAARYDLKGREIVYLSDSFLDPPNIYASPIQKFQPRRLTDIEPELDPQSIDVRQLSWPSRDGHWTIHGWLLLPRTIPQRRLPLLVFAEGGPIMVSPWFRAGWQYPLHAFLSNGVAVLIPNSRGRAGFGKDFQTTWEKERNPGQGPLDDDLDGVDYLVGAGIADPDRIGLAGISWGGYLAAFALTHTNRFKAIFVNEAVSLNVMEEGLAIAGNPSYIEFARQLGKGMPFDDDAERLRRLSPIYQTSNAKTPALLEFGANSGIRDGDALFQGLKHFNVPSELISYPRTGHGTSEPALLYDSARRNLEWFAYWVLGRPTQRMLKRYGPSAIAEWEH